MRFFLQLARARWWFVVALIFCNSTHADPTNRWVQLFGEAGERDARLVWRVHQWPADVIGFRVARREIASNTNELKSWGFLHTEPIRPGLDKEKDLRNVEPDETERARIRTNFGTLFKDQAVNQARQAFAGGLDKIEPFLLDMMYIASVRNFDRARLLGFGLRDPTVNTDRGAEYGLFSIMRDGRTNEQPAAVRSVVRFRADDPRLKATNFAAAITNGGMEISWSLPQAETWGLFACNVFRSGATGGNFEPLTSSPLAGSSLWRFVDTNATPNKAYQYAIVPVSVFGNELPSRTVFNYVAGSARTAISTNTTTSRSTNDAQLVIKSSVVVPNRGIQLKWDLVVAPPPPELTGFRVERAELPDSFAEDNLQVIKELPATAREYLDTDAKKDRFYAYRVTAVRNTTPISSTSLRAVAPDDFAPPAALQNLKAEWLRSGGKNFIRLRWTNPPGDTQIEGYALFVDNFAPGELLRQTGIPLIRGTQYDYEVANPSDRVYTLELAGQMRSGVLGERASVQCEAPGRFPQAPTGLALKRTNATAPLVLSWNYPDATRVMGFRVYDGDNRIADESTLKGNSRKWEFPPGRTPYAPVSVAAVIDAGIESQRSAGISYAPGYSLRPARPLGLDARWETKGKTNRIHVTWDPQNPLGNVSSYTLEADLTNRNKVEIAAELRDGQLSEYFFSPSQTNRSYTIRLRALGATGLASSAAEFLLLPPGAVLPPATLGEIFQVENRVFRFTWKYPEVLVLRGFRIYSGDRELVNETNLTATVREWISKPLDPGRHSFTIQAVSTNGPPSERGEPKVRVIK